VIPIQPNAHNVRNLRMKVRNKRNEWQRGKKSQFS